MPRLINKLGLLALRIAAVLVMVLAMLVGAARLLLPEAARFADDVRVAARAASGFDVDFQLLSAGMSWYGPELRLTSAEVRWPDGKLAFAADEIAIAADIYELMIARRPVPSLIHVEGLQVDVEVAADGAVLIQGRPWRDYLGSAREQTELTDLRISLENIRFGFRDLKRDIDEVEATLQHLFAVLEDDEVELEAEIRPDADLGRSLELEGVVPMQLLRDPARLSARRDWRLQLRAEDFRLDPWLKLVAIGNTPVIDSEGTAVAAVQFSGRQPVAVQTRVAIDELVLAQPDGEPAVYDELAGAAEWQRSDDGWEVVGRELRVARAGRRWPASDFSVTWFDDIDEQELRGNFSFLRLDDLMPLLAAFGGEQLQQAGIQGNASGEVWQVSGKLEWRDSKIVDYQLNADFEQLGYFAAGQGIDVSGLSGRLRADTAGGTVTFAANDARLGWDLLFREVLSISSLEGLALWRRGDGDFRLIVSDVHLTTPDGRGTAALELFSDNALQNPQIDFSAEASMADATQVIRYLPRTMPDKVIDWLQGALLQGRSDRTEFHLRGPVRKFPFRDDEGLFHIDIDFDDAALAYGPGWPAVENASGHLIFENESIYSNRNKLTISGIALENVRGRIADFREAVVSIDASADTDAAKVLGFLQNSPVAGQLGSVFSDIGAAGNVQGNVSLQIPIRDMENWQLQGSGRLSNVSAWLQSLQPRLRQLNGDLIIDRYFVSAPQLSGRLLDEDVLLQVEANPTEDARFSHRVSLAGAFSYARLRSELGLPDLGMLDGRTEIKAAAMFPSVNDTSRPFRLLVHSDLEGISSAFPYPLQKTAAGNEIFDAEILFPERNRIDARLNLERGVQAALDFRRTDGRWKLQGGLVEIGAPEPRPAGEDGVVVSAVLDRLSLDKWRDAFNEPDAPAAAEPSVSDAQNRWQDLFASAELLVGNLEMLGFAFQDTDVRADFGGSAWDVEMIGPWVEGRALIPYDLNPDAVIRADLARLLLIEPLEAADDEAGEYAVSPDELPAMTGTVNEFALGSMRLGRLDFDIRPIPGGLESRQLKLTAPSFGAVLAGDWQVIDSAQRSRLRMEFNSTDLQKALTQLGFAPLIAASQATLVSDLLWEGGPGMDAVEASTGKVSMTIRDGHINEVSSGGGRLLGLLSVASLPRRLALDFTDVTGDKLEFSKISGDFSIDFGDAWTCNLGLEGEIADMALVGRTGLIAEDYNQVAVVRPHVSNLMPVPAAFLGGPTVGVAALLVSQIFKKPLSGIGESYYTIRGPWENSDIRKVQRSELDTSPFADCEKRLPTLSPEEIAAFRELAQPPQSEPATAVPPAPPETTQQEATQTETTEPETAPSP